MASNAADPTGEGGGEAATGGRGSAGEGGSEAATGGRGSAGEGGSEAATGERGCGWRWLLVVGVGCALAAGAGAYSHATYNARVAADEPQYLITAMSIADDFDLDIADELAEERWRTFHVSGLPEQTKPLPGGQRVSPHDPLLPLLLALPMAVGGWVGAKLALAVVAGLLGATTTWVAVRRFAVAPGAASVTAVIFGTSAPLAVYGNQVYPELTAALAVIVAVGAVTGPLRRAGVWTLGAAVVALPWLSVKYVPVATVLALIGLVRLWRVSDRPGEDCRRRVAAGLAGGLALAGVVFLGIHHVVYGGWTPYAAGDHFVAGELSVVGFAPNWVGRSQRLTGLLVGRKFGIAAWQPAWLLAVPALGALVRARPAGWPALITPLAAGWLSATFVALTAQGYWFPGRQVVVVLGCAVVAVAWWVGRVRAVRLLVAVGLLGIVTYIWTVVETSTRARTLVVDFFRTANPLYRAWRWALPDYVTANDWTWPLHAVWVVVLIGLLALGWRREGVSAAQDTVNVVCMPSAKWDSPSASS